MRQQTLRNPISCTGIGLHSGVRVAMTLRPAEAGSGIVFRRLDRPAPVADVAARWDGVSDTTLGTTIGNDEGTSVATVEHLMAALYGCGVDNAIVELDGGEVPIMDGSAAPFVFLIECAGLIEQIPERSSICVLKTVEVEDDDRYACLSPYDGFMLEVEIDFDNPLIAHQSWQFDAALGTFKDQLCRARTFGFLDDVEALRARGLARGGSLENAIVVGSEGVINQDGLRYGNEFVRHKALDAVGDLYLAGAPLLGRYHSQRGGHSLNNRLLAALFADAEAWCRVTAGGALAAAPALAPDEAPAWQPATAAAIA
ncbi:MAG TPA: UDP-3-O-acyl-N-acetylglucosamine deacetylase [Alphaproteobacteria bacterium]|nr:UDP-3-O-acyl-N-acetylglucosamine deacetylase [Alphaproteobacteria bacterium]MDP6272326.1 UDP-3-O-acyl-N-acetylglucosamine deacetylase [Alphaproteobacteria bacterium]MDP7164751.1 UDP-3-O-acyl-N-acetylglucosamine deacetylase [Alphaproteobacteria bacterium]MDP7428311.1 UDP-3-O-acyl-N-acetylglucosamine deacetylase [Alphaproteobacteria bacterium]HJM51770.1 UDP-3-O-acyl-N-acetylglucosamine deacetylase [Alphaproteobacteria bacterium]